MDGQSANGGAIANLLRVARTECRATAAFAVVKDGHEDLQVHRMPPSDDGALGISDDTLAQIARRASGDPEFGSGRPFVRTVQLAPATILGVAPIPGHGSGAMVGVLCDDLSALGQPQLDLLDRLARRVDRHIRALRTVGPAKAPSDAPATAAIPAEPAMRTPARVEGPGTAAPTAGTAAPIGSLFDRPPPMPPPLGLGGFGDEPRGAVAPSGCDPGGARTWPGRAERSWNAAAGSLTGDLDLHPEPRGPHPEPRGPLPGWPGATAAAVPPEGRPPEPPEPPEPPAPGAWWAPSDPVAGLPGLGQFFSRAGRLLGSEARLSGAVALVLVEVPGEQTAAAAARALAAQLRFSDPLARVDRDLFAAAVLLFPDSMRGDSVEERLGAAVRSALDWLAPVRTTHVLAEPGDRRDVDELLRQALIGLPGRTADRNAR